MSQQQEPDCNHRVLEEGSQGRILLLQLFLRSKSLCERVCKIRAQKFYRKHRINHDFDLLDLVQRLRQRPFYDI